MYFTYPFRSQSAPNHKSVFFEFAIFLPHHVIAGAFKVLKNGPWQKESMLNVQVCRQGIKSVSWCC